MLCESVCDDVGDHHYHSFRLFVYQDVTGGRDLSAEPSLNALYTYSRPSSFIKVGVMSVFESYSLLFAILSPFS